MWCSKCSLLAKVIPIAITDLLIFAVTSFQRCVLIIDDQNITLPNGSDTLTCDITTTLSLEMCRSVSSACAPTLTAPLKAPIVFSGYSALYPR